MRFPVEDKKAQSIVIEPRKLRAASQRSSTDRGGTDRYDARLLPLLNTRTSHAAMSMASLIEPATSETQPTGVD